MSSALFRAVTCASPSAYEDTERLLPAGVPVVLPLYAAASLAGVLQAAGKPAARVSQMGHYTRPYCGQDLAGKRLLAWRGCGVGDQLVFAGCLAYLATRYPSARLDLVCDPRIAGGIWAGAENLPFNVLAEPITLAAWDAYDYHWICNGHCDGDHEPNQPDIWSGHLRSIGHDNAPASARFPLLPQSAAWTARAREFAEDIGALPRAPRTWARRQAWPSTAIPPPHPMASLRRRPFRPFRPFCPFPLFLPLPAARACSGIWPRRRGFAACLRS
jgi:hypothetical protein